MLLENLTQSPLRLNISQNPTLKLENFNPKLKVGQILNGIVQRSSNNGKAVVDFEGQKTVVEVKGNILKGQVLQAQVEKISPAPILRVLKISNAPVKEGTALKVTSKAFSMFSAESSPVENKPTLSAIKPGQVFKGEVLRVPDGQTVIVKSQAVEIPVQTQNAKLPSVGQMVSVKVQKDGGFVLLNSKPDAPAVDVSLFKTYLSSRKPFGEMVSILEKITDSPLFKQLKLDPSLSGRLKETMEVLFPKNSNLPDGKALQKQVELSGTGLEGKIKSLIANGNITNLRNGPLGLDLKGQLLELSQNLAQQAEKNPQTARQIESMHKHIRQAVDNIELQQLSNQLSRQENQPVVVQIPNRIFGEDKTLRLYIRDGSKKNGDSKSSGKDSFNLVFLLNLSSLGEIRADTQITGKKISAKIGSTDPAIVDFINMGSKVLEDRLKEMGFDGDVSGRLLTEPDMEIKEDFFQLLVEDSNRLVDIKT